MSKTQAVLFKVDKGWTTTKARAWLKKISLNLLRE